MQNHFHQPYSEIYRYQVIQRKTTTECAQHLEITDRTYKDKISGKRKFKGPELRSLSAFLNISQTDLIATSQP